MSEPQTVFAGKKRSDRAMTASGFERVPGDRYYTEPWVTRALLRRVRFPGGSLESSRRGPVWEPACGRGDMVDVLTDAGYVVMASDIEGTSLGCTGAAELDFLKAPSPGDGLFSIVTNPPYTLAEPFIRHALELTARASGMVAMLMRNEYDCAAGRRDLFERESFAGKLVLTKRPRWIDGEHSASQRHNFAWYLWDHHHSGPAGIGWIP